MPQVAVASLGIPPPTTSKYKSTAERTNTVSETVCIYDATAGNKLASHRLEGACSGLGASRKGILTTRAGKATTAVFAWGRESPLSRFAAPEQLGPIMYSNDGAHVAAGGLSGSVYIWESCTGQLLCSWKAHYRRVLTIRFCDDDSVLVTASDDAMVHLWDFATVLMNTTAPERGLLRTVSTNKTGVTGVACGIGGINSRIATSSLDHSCRIFHAASGTEIFCATFPGSLLCVGMDITESQVFTGSSDGSVHVGEVNSGKCFTLAGHEAAVNSIQAVSSGSAFTVISGSDDGTLRWWDTFAKSPLKVIRIEGNSPVKEIRLVDIETLNFSSLKSSKGQDQLPLKKLMEDDAEDRWIITRAETSWERKKRLSSLFSISSGGDATSKKSKGVSEQEEQKWLSISNRLYSLLADSVVNKIANNKE